MHLKKQSPDGRTSGLQETTAATNRAENDNRAFAGDPVVAATVLARLSPDELRVVQSTFERDIREARNLSDQVDAMFGAALACALSQPALPHLFLGYLPTSFIRSARHAGLPSAPNADYVRGLVSAAHDVVRIVRGVA